MQTINAVITFRFQEDQSSITYRKIVADSINITRQLYNDLHSSSSTCTLQLIDDGSGLIEKLINTTGDVTAFINADEHSSNIFQGVLSNDYSWRVSMTGEDVFQIKLEDFGVRYLNMPYAKDDGTFIDDTLENIVADIASRVKISNTFTPNVWWSGAQSYRTKHIYNKIDSSLTCKEMLDQICYELGLVYYFDNSYGLHIQKTPDLTATPTITIATTADSSTQFTPNYYLYQEGNNGVDLTRKARQYSQAKVTYCTLSDSQTPVPIYKAAETIEVPGGEWWDGATHTENIYEPTLDEYFVADKTYYLYNSGYVEATIYPADDTDPTHTPKVGDLVPDSPVYYEYAGQASLIDMTDINNGKEILGIYPETINPNLAGQTINIPGYVEKNEEMATPSKWTLKQHGNTDKLEILIDNMNSGTSAFYNLYQAKARIIRKQATSNIYRSLVGLTALSENQFNYEAQWIHEKDDAIALCELLSNYYLYCDNTYTFYCKDDIALGQVVRVYENLYSGLDTNMFLIAKQYSGYGAHAGLYKYIAQGITAFDLTSTTRAEQYVTPEDQPTLIDTITTYALDDQGRNPDLVTGWLPIIPATVTGQYLWTRIQYIYSNGNTYYEYSVSFVGDETFEFSATISPDTYSKNYRTDSFGSYAVTIVQRGFTGTPLVTAWFTSEGSYEDPYWQGSPPGDTVIFNIPMNKDVSGYFDILVELPGTTAGNVFMRLPIVDETITNMYIGECSVDTSAYFDADGNLIPENYSQIDWSAVDSAYFKKIEDMFFWFHEILVEGDSFFNNFKNPITGFEDCLVYVWNNEKWVPINYSTLSNSERSKILAQAQKDVLSTIEPGTVTKSDFGYFNTIIAGTVTADYIGSKEIELHNGGFMYGGDVDLTQPAGQRLNTGNPGFCFDSEGNGELSNIRITGMSTVEGQSSVLGTMTNYDSNGELVFKTVKETTNSATLSGSKQDGIDAPSAYQWKEFHDWLQTQIVNNATSGTYYSASGTLRGTWSGSTIDGRAISGIKYWSSVPTTTSTNQVNGDRGATVAETKTMYTNPNNYWIKFREIKCHPKTEKRADPWAATGYGALRCTTYYSNGTAYDTFCNSPRQAGNYGQGLTTVNDRWVPPYGYIVAVADTWDGFLTPADTDLYMTFTYAEADNFNTGINLIDSSGNIYAYDSIIPNTNSLAAGYTQSLTCSDLNLQLNMQYTAASNWPVTKYYRFQYTQSPGTYQTVTTSIFTQSTFNYGGRSLNVASITYDNFNLKVTTTLGENFEFVSNVGNYYEQYNFTFVAAAESLGAYARTFLPTDDSNVHDIGASGDYNSGISQRWHNGFFNSVNSRAVESGWSVDILTSSGTLPLPDDYDPTASPGDPHSLDDVFPVHTMRPYLVNNASTISITMPGNSSQQYVVMANNVIVVSLVGAGKNPHYELVNGGASLSLTWTSSAEPYLLVYVIRIQ